MASQLIFSNNASAPAAPAAGTVTLYSLNDNNVYYQNSSATIGQLLTAAGGTFTGALTLVTGAAAVTPLTFVSGTLNTTPVAGGMEYDGVATYITNDTTSGRGAVEVDQYFHLTAAGATISTIANYFGTTSNISLVANGYYEIEIFLYYLKTTAGTVTWTLTNSSAPTSMNVFYEMSPITGVVATPGTATLLCAQVYNNATAAYTITTGTLTTAVNHYARFKIFLQNGTGTSLLIQATASAGTITPGINSWWKCVRRVAGNVGNFHA